MKLVSWNCRGLGHSSKTEVVNDLVRMASLDVLMLQETKIDEDSLLSTSGKRWKTNVGKVVSARGTAGGIATYSFSLENSFTTQHWIFTKLCHIPSKQSICLFNLYVPVNIQEKRACWNSLVECLDSNSFSNIIVIGDLNLILNEKEKSGGVYGKDPVLKLVDKFILSWELIDFKPKCGRFTWSNNRLRAANISARLDHFLVQSSMLLDKKVISSSILPKITSDHKPIL